MKVNGRKEPTPVSPLYVMPEPSRSQQRAEETRGGSEDAVSVDLSDSSRRVREARLAAASMPDVRMDKVAGLRDAIEEGSYQVESEKIARKMVDEALRESIRLRRDKNS